MTIETVYESKLYRLNPLHSIEMLAVVERPGHPADSLTPPQPSFIGHAQIKGILPGGKSFNRKVSFDIPAKGIFEAADLFDAMLAKEVARMNRPRFVK